MRKKMAAVSRQPAKPQAPKQAKNCHSSWPETKPAPRKTPT